MLAQKGQTLNATRTPPSFFASLKKELVHGAGFATRAEARAALVEYIEVFYNSQRRHSSLGYVSPAEYEQAE
jgi:putative transposase